MTKSRHIRWSTDQVVRAGRQAPPGEEASPPPRRKRKRNPETNITSAVRDLLRLHRAVEWVERINTGAAVIRGQYVAFGFKGCADLIGQTTAAYGGAFIAVETKAPRKYPSRDQRAFLAMVAAAGGFAAWGRSVTDIEKALADWVAKREAHQMSLRG